MSGIVPNIARRVKEWVHEREGDIFLIFGVFLVVLLVFGLFQLRHIQKEAYPIQFRDMGNTEGRESAIQAYRASAGLPGLVAASSKGTRYYYPWCGGITRLSEKNKIWFQTEQEAEAAGYKIASGCDGL